ncbi:MAG: hypothetical protein PHP22_08830 [Oscillospiraceae bacterium]|nr:hypothetical protein [Oscillospiraceae bacterium]
MEIGSEFWIEKELNETSNASIPDWLNGFGDVVLTSSGRGAISLILSQISPRVKRALVPSYVCESVILPFERAGYELVYYEVDEFFVPKDISTLNTEIGVFLHMGYFGFSTNEILVGEIEKLRARSVIIIEDVTHTLFSKYNPSPENDYVVGSLRKWLGVPCGGFAAAVRQKMDCAELPPPPQELIELRTNSLRQKRLYMQTIDESLKKDFLNGFSEAEKIFDDDVGAYQMDRLSVQIILEVDIERIVHKRRENYRFLLEQLSEKVEIRAIFNTLPESVCPFIFPVIVAADRDQMRRKLIEEKIYCPIHWPIPKQVDHLISSGTRATYDSILSIPCDQRYNLTDMNRIVCALKYITD